MKLKTRYPKIGDAVHVQDFVWYNPQVRDWVQDHRGTIINVDFEDDPDDPKIYVQFDVSKRTDEFDEDAFLNGGFSEPLNTWTLQNVR